MLLVCYSLYLTTHHYCSNLGPEFPAAARTTGPTSTPSQDLLYPTRTFSGASPEKNTVSEASTQWWRSAGRGPQERKESVNKSKRNGQERRESPGRSDNASPLFWSVLIVPSQERGTARRSERASPFMHHVAGRDGDAVSFALAPPAHAGTTSDPAAPACRPTPGYSPSPMWEKRDSGIPSCLCQGGMNFRQVLQTAAVFHALEKPPSPVNIGVIIMSPYSSRHKTTGDHMSLCSTMQCREVYR